MASAPKHSSGSAFGCPRLGLLLDQTPEAVPDEEALLQAVLDKVGPHATRDKLLWHLRASRGKVHCAINTYLRDVLAIAPRFGREDFDPQQRQHRQDQEQQEQQEPQQEQQQEPPQPPSSDDQGATTGSLAASEQGDGDEAAVQLDGLPGNVLEAVLSRLDLQSVLSCACSCQALHRAAQADHLWQQLFLDSWGTVLFPTSRHGSCGRDTRNSSSSSSKHTATATTTASPAASSAPVGSPGVAASPAAAAAGRAGVQRAPVPRFHAELHPGRQQPARGAAPAAAATTSGSGTASQACHSDKSQPQQQQQHSAGGALPAAAPAGSWQRQFKQQYAYAASRTCPKCGEHTILPVVYGYPSVPLLAGVSAKRLLLGGDHLLPSCHVWACGGCRSCYRFYPYVNVQLWLADEAQEQRQDQARAAAEGGAGGDEAGGGGGAGGPLHGSNAAEQGFPRYTYEL